LALDKDHHRKPGRVAFRLSQWVAFLLTFTFGGRIVQPIIF
jgi:hypothetical protein